MKAKGSSSVSGGKNQPNGVRVHDWLEFSQTEREGARESLHRLFGLVFAVPGGVAAIYIATYTSFYTSGRNLELPPAAIAMTLLLMVLVEEILLGVVYLFWQYNGTLKSFSRNLVNPEYEYETIHSSVRLFHVELTMRDVGNLVDLILPWRHPSKEERDTILKKSYLRPIKDLQSSLEELWKQIERKDERLAMRAGETDSTLPDLDAWRERTVSELASHSPVMEWAPRRLDWIRRSLKVILLCMVPATPFSLVSLLGFLGVWESHANIESLALVLLFSSIVAGLVSGLLLKGYVVRISRHYSVRRSLDQLGVNHGKEATNEPS